MVGNNPSRLMLGTVQFGLSYGVANRVGQPDYQDVVEIVAAALEGGVNAFDTAAAYGTSEEVLTISKCCNEVSRSLHR